MRELKFRAWYKNERFDFVELVSYKDGSLGVSVGRSGFSDLTCAPDETIVELFTGLKDKNGVDIYENDIITYNFHTSISNNSYKSKVFFDEYMWLTDEHSINRINNVEVIGNIHENKDLV
jgi:uncharacterized phage protein (TIGR01671 family)